MFRNLGMEQGRDYGKDLYDDRLVRWIDRVYLLWVILTFGIPFANRLLRSAARWQAGLEGLVWGGLLRIFALPARDLQRELDLPHVRPQGLPFPRRGAEQLARRDARVRGGLAQQPPRVPRVGAARARAPPDRRLVVGDPRRSSGSVWSGTSSSRTPPSSSAGAFTRPPETGGARPRAAAPNAVPAAAASEPHGARIATPCRPPGISV